MALHICFRTHRLMPAPVPELQLLAWILCRDIGIRFHPPRGAMSLGASKGGLPPDSCCEEEDACLKDMRRVIEEYHDNDRWSFG